MTDTLEEGQELAPEPPAKPKKTAATTDAATTYVVLTLQTENAWVHRGTVEARSSEQAVREFSKAGELPLTDETTLVAIPARSWRPVKVTAKVTTSLVIEEAT